MIKNLLLVGTGGFIGTVLRFIIQVYGTRLLTGTWPLATFIINIAGSFLIGIVYALSEKGNLISPEMRIFLAVGLCGGFTTFSAFSYDNLMLLKDNSIFYFLLNAGGSVFAGILAVYAGIILTRSIF
jgi:fluoride exporter